MPPAIQPSPAARAAVIIAVLLLAAGAGCRGTGGTDGVDRINRPSSADRAKKTAEALPKVTFLHETMPLGDVVRKVGEEVGGGLVLMGGLEEYSMPATDFRSATYEELANRFAGAVDGRVEPLANGYFIYPQGYDGLLALDLEGKLDGGIAGQSASIAFGAKTPLSNVFAVLSQSLGATLIVDNHLAEAVCGEMFLDNAPVPRILEAVLMSARIAPGGFRVESTGEYTFFFSVKNTNPPSVLLNGENLTGEQQALLDRKVTVVLPAPGANPVETAFAAKATPLREVLTPLTRQLGIEVAARRSMADIPINPCVFQNVRTRTVFELLIRQWPEQGYGFEVEGNRFLIREK